MGQSQTTPYADMQPSLSFGKKVILPAEVVLPNPMGLSILHKCVVMLLQEEVGVPVKAGVLVDCLTHFPSVQETVTNIAVVRTSGRAGRAVRTESNWRAALKKDFAGILGGESIGPEC